MPSPSASPATTPADNLLNAVADRLIPLFLTPGQSEEQARTAALGAIAAYHPESPADLANIARILAFSLAAVAAIGKGADPDLPPSLQLRYLGKANTLSRSADQAERAMLQRRRQQAVPPTKTPASPQPATPADEHAVLAQVDAAMAELSGLQPGPLAAKPAARAAAAPPSFRRALHQHTPLGALHLSA